MGRRSVNRASSDATKSVAFVFLGSRLGTLSGEGDGQRLIEIADSTEHDIYKSD